MLDRSDYPQTIRLKMQNCRKRFHNTAQLSANSRYRNNPTSEFFQEENRIIVEFLIATLLTEAALKSGALIMTRFCAEYGKDVFTVLGSIHSSAYSKGINDLA
jgi:predicted Rossmann fold nucleotide-binding protein DprA/Smf involved in DNA uptake